jgi:hypothetical protein
MGVGRNESGVQTWPNQRCTPIYTYGHNSLSFKMHLAHRNARQWKEQHTIAQEDAEREKFERSSHFALDKKKAGRWAAHAKKADSLQLETYQYCIWKRVQAHLDTRDETARAT